MRNPKKCPIISPQKTAFLLIFSMLLSVFTGYSYTALAEDLTEAEQTTIQTEYKSLKIRTKT